MVKLQTEICWFGTSSLPQDLQMVRWTRPSVKRYLLFLKSQHSQHGSMTRKHRKRSKSLLRPWQLPKLVARSWPTMRASNASHIKILSTRGTYCHIMYCISLYLFVSLCISWCLFVWFRMSPPGNAMCKALHHLAAAAPLLCALGVCKRHQKTLRIGRYWEILRVYEYLVASL